MQGKTTYIMSHNVCRINYTDYEVVEETHLLNLVNLYNVGGYIIQITCINFYFMYNQVIYIGKCYFALKEKIKLFNLIKIYKRHFNFYLNIKLLLCNFTFIDI